MIKKTLPTIKWAPFVHVIERNGEMSIYCNGDKEYLLERAKTFKEQGNLRVCIGLLLLLEKYPRTDGDN